MAGGADGDRCRSSGGETVSALRVGTTRSGKPFTLPDSIVTATMAILAKKGAGKTYTAGVIEEEFAQHHIPFVVLDPIGVHYGLRSTADGKAAGYPVVVFGGLHADVPLHQKMGTDLAKTIATENISAIIDLSELSKTAWREFVRDFCRALFTHNRTPRHVFIEEATEFVPQRQMTPGMQETYEAVERMVRLGRNRGIGVTLIAQRSAQVAKDCLSQIDVLIAMRHTGKHDRDAIIDAIKDDLDDQQLARDLPAFRQGVTSLDDGEAWVWWPKNGIFEQIKVRQRVTFHGGATPVMGKKQAQPVMATPDLDKLRDRFKAIIEQREADDPKKLRNIIAMKDKLIVSLQRSNEEARRVVACDHLDDMATMSRTIERQHDLLVKVGGEIAEDLGHIGTGQERLRLLLTTLEQWSSGEQVETFKRAVKSATILPKPVPPPPALQRGDGTIAIVDLSGSQQRLLDAILAFEVLGLAEVPRPVVAAHARVRHTTGTFKNNISRLSVSGLIDKRGQNLVLTDAGRALANVPTVPLTLDAFHEAWRSLLTGPQAAMLDQIIAAYPAGIEREEIAASLDVKATTGTFKNNVSKLNVLGLIAKEGSALTATALLFPEGLA